MANREGLRGPYYGRYLSHNILTTSSGSLLPMRCRTGGGLHSCKGEGVENRRREIRG